MKHGGNAVKSDVQNIGAWAQLSGLFSQTIEAIEGSIVAIDSGGRTTASGVVWRQGVVVTSLHNIRHREGIELIGRGESLPVSLIGSDAATDLAVIKVDSRNLVPVESIDDHEVRTGEVVLAVGRSGLGDISASCGIIARTGNAWQTWSGGLIDRLIRPDIRLYVGQSGSALVNQGRQVLGINSPVLARQAVITIPTRTVNRIVDAILENGHVPRPYLGVAMQAVPIPEQVRLEFPEGAELGLLIMQVEPKGPAASAGVMVGDLIVSANSEAVHRVRDILHRVASSRIGDTISLVVIRGGAKLDLAVEVVDRG
jgi:S1-C subfamily serine protease